MKLVILDTSVVAFGIGAKIGELYPFLSPRKDTIRVYNYAYKLAVDSLKELTSDEMIRLATVLVDSINQRFNDVPVKSEGEKRADYKARLTEYIQTETPKRLNDIIGQSIPKTLSTKYQQALDAIELYAHIAADWVNQLGWAPMLQQQDCAVVWAVDSKPYWRTSIDPNYKGCRNAKIPQYYAAFKGIGQADGVSAEIPGQEADDVAAAIVRLWLRESSGQFDQIFLGTIDSDWHGLVQSPNIFWLNLKNYPPRIRSKEIIFNWLCSKHKQQSKRKQNLWPLPDYNSFNPAHIWDWKVAVGDSADNLGEDSARLMIDLLHPPKHFDPLQNPDSINTLYSAINKAKKGTKSSVPATELELAMLELGVTAPIDTLAIPANLIL
ncbi:MAG: hypothetical protein AAGA46_00160 [Cyanobacteria bacterium P01_F01_bin.13]